MAEGSNIYVRLWGVNLKKGIGFDGSEFQGGDDLQGNGTWVPISSFGFSAARNITMSIGKKAGIADAGMSGFSAVGITKELDDFSEILLSRLISPVKASTNAKATKGKYIFGGDTVSIVVTNSHTDQFAVTYQITLLGCHIMSYNIGGSSGSAPFESLQICYSNITSKFWYWDPDSTSYQAGGPVTFDLPSNKAESYYNKS